MTMKYGHWDFPHEFDVNEWFGFVYRIIDKTTNQEYIGKKQFFRTTRRKVKGRKNRRVVKTPSKWENYTSSSSHVNQAIEDKGIENFEFIIESLHKTKASLSYAEVEKQVKENVLREKHRDGTPKYYNKQIGAVKYIPPEPTNEELRFKRATN